MRAGVIWNHEDKTCFPCLARIACVGHGFDKGEFRNWHCAVCATFKHWFHGLHCEPGDGMAFLPLSIVDYPQPQDVVVAIEYHSGMVVRLSGSLSSFLLGLLSLQRP